MKKIKKKIYFWELCLVAISTYITFFFINFFIIKKNLNEENKIILANLVNAKKKHNQINYSKNYDQYLIINHGTEKFEEMIQEYGLTPLSTYANRDITLCNESGNLVKFSSDNFGFRNKNSIYSSKEKKIIFLGDSFILGYCHDDDLIIWNIVDKNIVNREILNLSQAGTGPLIQSAILREYINNINFDTVVWFLFTGNDFHNLRSEMSNKYIKEYLDQRFTQNLKTQQNKIDSMYFEIQKKFYNLVNDMESQDFTKTYKEKKIEYFRLWKLDEIRKIFLSKNIGQIDKNIIDEYLSVIIDTKNTYLEDKKLVIAILPEERSFKLDNYDKFYRLDYIKRKLKEGNIDIIDLSTKYKKKYKFLDFYYSRYSHYTEIAQQIIADDLIEFINSK